MPTSRITIAVNPDRTLSYTQSGSGGSTNGAKSHRVFRNCDLEFFCESDFAIQFTLKRKPFTNNVAGEDLSVSATGGSPTSALTGKNSWTRRTMKYFVAVAGQGVPPIITEDPEMEDGGD